ncbi:DUF4174 domain-containing protein [Maribacter sp. MJ134]|nr:DUF4174 domain-containing protein [Maribacter sp. MJ134]
MAFLFILMYMHSKKTFCFTIIYAICFMLYSQDMADFKWTNRILIFADSDQKLIKAKSAIQVFKSLEKEVKERALLLFVYSKGAFFNCDGVRLRLKSSRPIESSFDGIILLGKDGGVKFKEPYPVKAETIFELIDGMPMRRAEMKD